MKCSLYHPKLTTLAPHLPDLVSSRQEQVPQVPSVVCVCMCMCACVCVCFQYFCVVWLLPTDVCVCEAGEEGEIQTGVSSLCCVCC